MKKTLEIQIAERIAQLLKEKGLRQQDLADRTEMTKSRISQIMHGTSNLTIGTIQRLERVLGGTIIRI
jgi:transcriptional regulator with XRE-family HTH domain